MGQPWRTPWVMSCSILNKIAFLQVTENLSLCLNHNTNYGKTTVPLILCLLHVT